MQIGLVIWHLEDISDPKSFRLIFANSAASEGAGVDMEQFIGQTMLEAFPVAFETELAQQYYDVVRTGKASDLGETWYGDENVPRSIFTLKVFPLPDNHMGIAFENVTERKQVEERLSYQANILQNVSDAIIATDLELRITNWNSAAAEIYGWKAHEAEGKNIDDFLKTVFLGETQQAIQKQLLDEDRWEGEISQQRKDGETLYVRAAVSWIRGSHGNIIGGVTVNHNITQRKRLEKGLRESEARIGAVVNTAVDGIITISEKGIIGSFNPAAEKMFGYSADEVISKNVKILMPEPYTSKHDEYLSHYQQTGEKKIIGIGREVVGQRKDGTTFPIELAVSEIHEGGEHLFTGIVRDITERKQAEAQIKASLREKDVLLKEIHHRVKNNLQVMSSLIHLQARYSTDEQILQTLKEVQNRIQSMALIHEKLHQSEDMARIDFSEYIQSLVANLCQTYAVQSAAITMKTNVDDIFLNIDTAIPCGLIINELVSNTLKYAFTEGVKGEIRIGFHSDTDNQLTLTVSDNGVGFPQDLDFRKTKSLGLRLVNILTKQLDGTIKLDRSDGTKFEITF